MKGQKGFSLVEVAVALLLAALGSLGFLVLMVQTQDVEIETMQRESATRLVAQMSSMMKANKEAIACYGMNTHVPAVAYIGTGFDPNAVVYNCSVFEETEARDQALRDLASWHDQLLGAGEAVDLDGDGVAETDVSGMIDARGCVTYDAATDSFRVEVAWLGNSPSGVSASACGQGAFPNDSTGADTLRRVLGTTVRVADLG